MDPTSGFFEKLRKVCVTLETETAELQDAFLNRNDVDSEDTDRALRTYHELYSDAMQLKGQMRDKMAQQKTKENEVASFIKACKVVEQRFREDIDKLRGHCENYGYQAPQNNQPCTNEEEGGGVRMTMVKEAQQKEPVEEQSAGTPAHVPLVDPMRTPQMADFGLSELHLRNVLGAASLFHEVPAMPDMGLPPHSPCMPVTPKCNLRMDEEDEPPSPHMRDFGIVERTMCLNNDFTMDLHRKDVEKAQRCLPVRPFSSVMDGLSMTDKMETPEPPVFSTFMMKKAGACSSPPPPDQGRGTCSYPSNLQMTPELPVFQTPYMNKLLSTRKGIREAEQGYPRDGSENMLSERTPVPPHHESASRCAWDYAVPEILIGAVQNKTPEIPSLESLLGRSLLSRTASRAREHTEWEEGPVQPCVPLLLLDGPTQEFSLGSPRVRESYMEAEPSTPEMPDLSSVTMDVCKLVSQIQAKKMSCAAQPQARPPGKENRGHSIPVITEGEFQSLPSYLRQMSLYSLNQVLHKINNAAKEKSQGQGAVFQMDDLKKITGIGPQGPIYFLCLTELKRLEHVQGAGINSVYKLPLAS